MPFLVVCPYVAGEHQPNPLCPPLLVITMLVTSFVSLFLLYLFMKFLYFSVEAIAVPFLLQDCIHFIYIVCCKKCTHCYKSLG
jgi:hypothetical protein